MCYFIYFSIIYKLTGDKLASHPQCMRIPTNAFGIYVPRMKETHSYWHPEYKVLKPNILQREIQRIFQSLNNYEEMAWMIRPIYPIKNGIMRIDGQNIPFNNTEYGIIAINSRGHRTTFLPHTFTNTDWQSIHDSILQTNGDLRGVFYAYRTEHTIFPPSP